MQDLKKASQADLYRRLDALQADLRDHPQRAEIERVLEDLQVHQIELELQARELREAHVALEESRDRYADLYDFAPVGYLTLDQGGRILEINLTGARLLGVERAELIGRPLSTLLETDSLPGLFAHLKEVFARSRKIVTELQLRPRTDGPLDVRLESIVVTSLDEGLVCRTVLVDDTERKQAERALAEREAEQRAVIETTSDGFWVVDQQGRILAVNEAYVRRSGYSRSELLNMHIRDLEASESPEMVRRHIARVRREGNDLFETQHRTRSGEIWPAEINTAYWPSGGGRFFAFVRDISERNALERQIIETSTAEQERIGHEIHDGIGQQLTAITMLAKSLEHRLKQDENRQAAELVRSLIEHLQQTLRDTRALAKGLSPIELGPEGLGDALGLLVEQTQTVSGIRCRFDGGGRVGRIDGAVTAHLYRIAQEAVHNATRHAKPSRIDVSLTSTDHTIVLSIRDDGSGKLPEKSGDSGLGMAIMRYRARLIGASLTIAPGESGGTLVRCIWHRPD